MVLKDQEIWDFLEEYNRSSIHDKARTYCFEHGIPIYHAHDDANSVTFYVWDDTLNKMIRYTVNLFSFRVFKTTHYIPKRFEKEARLNAQRISSSLVEDREHIL